MECPKCGFVLIEDRWICENCGAEIQIVPDFEPELENSISEVLLNVADEINPQQKAEVTVNIEEHVNHAVKKTEEAGHTVNTSPKKVFSYLKRYMIISICAIVFVMVIIPFSVVIYRNNSASYQLSRARAYEEIGDYENAIARIIKADSIRPNDAEIRLLWAAYCFSAEDYEKAVEILLEMINSPRYTWAEKDLCYDNIIIIWHLMGKYQEISELVRLSRDEDLIEEFKNYLSWPPAFSEESGEFSGGLLLELTSNFEGMIFYTLDGTEPTAESKVYMVPIPLEAGEHFVSVLFRNKFGVFSDVVMNHYIIDIKAPEPPVVPLTSGRYIEPMKISVIVPVECEVYYTIDGSDPTPDSEFYDEPIEMALGITEYRFIAIDADGVASEIVTREFEFRLNSDITLEIAEENVLKAQLRRGRVVDMNGKAMEETGYFTYIFESFVDIAEKGLYFMFVEYYYEDDGELIKTGHIFAASAITGEAAHLIYNELGILDAIVI